MLLFGTEKLANKHTHKQGGRTLRVLEPTEHRGTREADGARRDCQCTERANKHQEGAECSCLAPKITLLFGTEKLANKHTHKEGGQTLKMPN